MKTISILALGLFPLALAIDQPKSECRNFLGIRITQRSMGRGRRSPMEFGFYDGSGEDSTVSPVVVTEMTTAQTKGFTTNPTDAPTTNPTDAPTTTTSAPTTNPTDAPTTTTSAPTTNPTDAPTTKDQKTRNTEPGGTTTPPATDAPTTNPTDAPTTNDPKSQNTEPAETTSDPTTTTEALTTLAKTTEKATTEKATTEKATTTEAAATVTVEEENDKAIIVMLDATGSMQNIGGRGKGRDLVVRKMEKFRQMLVKRVKNDKIIDQKITFITFNERAVWKTYDSIDQWPSITRKNYNPGYQTNLFDTMGCVLSEFKARAAYTDASVYLISDGVHAMQGKKKGREAYQDHEVKEMVEELREDGWHFNFYGATDENKKEALKSQAGNLGFRQAEMKVFDFNKKQFGELLKSMLKTMVKNDNLDKEPKDNKQIPECDKCQKGRAGKMCRKRRQNQIAAGLCIKA